MKEVRNLSEQLEQHRKSLRDVNNSLKRLSGRVKPNGDEENRSFSNKRGDQQHQRQDSKSNHRLSNSSSSSHSQSNRHEKNNVDLKRLADEATQRVLKRKMIDDDPSRYNPKRTMLDRSSSRTSEHDDYDADSRRQSSIRSSVVSKNIKTREDLIQLQTKHNGSEQRNRRMIGLLVGTLREFKSDDTERSQTKQALDRKELEKKIEEKKLEEKQKMLEERRKLEQEKYKSIRNIKILEKKIDLTQAFEDWEKNQRRLRHFLRTKTEPAIFFLPRLLRPDTQSLLESNALLVEQQIAAKRSELDRELDALTQESAALMASDDFIAVDNEEDGDGDDEDEVWEEAAAEDKDTAAVKQTDELLDKEPNDVQLEETGDEVTTDQTTTTTATAVIADEK